MPEITILACDKCGSTEGVIRYTVTMDEARILLLDPLCAAKVSVAEAYRLGLPAPADRPRRAGVFSVLGSDALRALHRPRQ